MVSQLSVMFTGLRCMHPIPIDTYTGAELVIFPTLELEMTVKQTLI